MKHTQNKYPPPSVLKVPVASLLPVQGIYLREATGLWDSPETGDEGGGLHCDSGHPDVSQHAGIPQSQTTPSRRSLGLNRLRHDSGLVRTEEIRGSRGLHYAADGGVVWPSMGERSGAEREEVPPMGCPTSRKMPRL